MVTSASQKSSWEAQVAGFWETTDLLRILGVSALLVASLRRGSLVIVIVRRHVV